MISERTSSPSIITARSIFVCPTNGRRSGDDLQAKVFAVALGMYASLAEAFRAAAPDDINYIAVKGTWAERLDDAAAVAKPWLTARNPAAWEQTPCVVVSADGSFAKEPRDGF